MSYSPYIDKFGFEVVLHIVMVYSRKFKIFIYFRTICLLRSIHYFALAFTTVLDLPAIVDRFGESSLSDKCSSLPKI